MKSQYKIFPILLFIAFLTACSMPTRSMPTPAVDVALVSTIAAMTLQAYPSQTLAPAATQAIATLTPAPTLTVTITPTFQTPLLQFTGNTNCRLGPGTGYDVNVVMLSGKQAEPIGVSQDGNYWLIKNPGGESCWVAKDFVQPSGSVSALPTVMAPPTPSPVPPNAPGLTKYDFTCDFASGGSNMTMNLVWADRSNNEEGFTIYRDDQAVATLAANTTSYTDVAFVGAGKSLSYRIEAFSQAGRASSGVISASCQ